MSLTKAAKEGNIDEVRRLLNLKVDINAVDIDGDSALTCAVKGKHLEIVRLLLDAGADINLTVKYGRTALIFASFLGLEEIINLLLERKALLNVGIDATPLTGAMFRGHSNIVRLLLNAGANINHPSGNGRTVLMVAALKGDLDTVKLLLRMGANKDLLDREGNTALSLAQTHKQGQYEEVIELLTKRPSSNLGIETRLPAESQAEYEANECPICLQLLYRPVILPCGHGPYCKGCLKSKSDSSCPRCEERYKKDTLKTNKEIEARCDALRKKATPAPKGGRRHSRRHGRRGTRRSYTR